MAKIHKAVLLFIFLIIFKNWFLNPFLIASDWPYFFAETLADFPLFPPAWAPTNGIGLGGEVVLYALDNYIYFLIGLFVNLFGLPWEIVYKVFIFGLFIFLSIFSSSYLVKTVLRRVSILSVLLTSLLFTANTYILMVVGGGQVGVALAYSMAPVVLGTFMKLINNLFFIQHNFKFSIITGLVLAIQVMFDARITYITMIAVGLYFLFYIVLRMNIRQVFYAFFSVILIPVGITILLHTSWILPLLVFQSSLAQDVIIQQTSLGAFKFFSFASFSQTFSLLHPNWPENIFGKVYFMKSEFLLLPILAYLSLLFLGGKQRIIVVFFALLGILGAFLAKGANEPFGLFNELMYRYIPGMSMFRDPTKFYLLTTLSYMILIPFSVYELSTTLKNKLHPSTPLSARIQKNLSNFLLLFVIFYLLFLIRPVFLNQLGGTFKQQSIPQEYKDLKDFFVKEQTFFRILWIPQPHRYNFYSYTHPVVFGDALLKATNSAEVVNQLSQKKTQQYLSEVSVKYIIVPYDSFGEIFVHDRKYDDKQYLDLVSSLDKITWLKKIDDFGKIIVYEVPNIKDHFRLTGKESTSYKMINPFEYEVNISGVKPGVLFFSEKYSPYWIAQIDNKITRSKKTKEGLNSFFLEKEGRYRIYFEKQEIYNYGRIISAGGVLLIIVLLWKTRRK